jgi:hypothetical protein
VNYSSITLFVLSEELLWRGVAVFRRIDFIERAKVTKKPYIYIKIELIIVISKYTSIVSPPQSCYFGHKALLKTQSLWKPQKKSFNGHYVSLLWWDVLVAPSIEFFA